MEKTTTTIKTMPTRTAVTGLSSAIVKRGDLSCSNGQTPNKTRRRRVDILFQKRWIALVVTLSFVVLMTFLGDATDNTAVHTTATVWNHLQNRFASTRQWISDDGADTFQARHRRLEEETFAKESSSSSSPVRLLYVVTTLSEYDRGTRNTVRGHDRYRDTVIPVVAEGVRSMTASGYAVDVVLICHYALRPERRTLLRDALSPHAVRLDVWDEAAPLGYTVQEKHSDASHWERIENQTKHLSRQHRFVLKDRIRDYDVFACFEDDMLVKGVHVDHHRAVSDELRRLREDAPTTPLTTDNETVDAATTTTSFAGPLTRDMIRRIIPGFIRVEALLDERRWPAQNDTGPVPVDLDFSLSQQRQQRRMEQGHVDDDSRSSTFRQIDSSICCHVSSDATGPHRPQAPRPDEIMLWETHVYALGIRRMPTESWLDWVVLQRGRNQNDVPRKEVIGDYWSNRHYNYFDTRHRPVPHRGKFLNNQGGWMATREQLWEWHTELCPGGFLPPFDEPDFTRDGLDQRNVEYYSGGLQIVTAPKLRGCNLQRIILLDPTNFSKSLLYHTANNKQRQLAWRREEMFSKANTLLGQLNHLKKKAIDELRGIIDTTNYIKKA